jgi:hypothetical protein
MLVPITSCALRLSELFQAFYFRATIIYYGVPVANTDAKQSLVIKRRGGIDASVERCNLRWRQAASEG